MSLKGFHKNLSKNMIKSICTAFKALGASMSNTLQDRCRLRVLTCVSGTVACFMESGVLTRCFELVKLQCKDISLDIILLDTIMKKYLKRVDKGICKVDLMLLIHVRIGCETHSFITFSTNYTPMKLTTSDALTPFSHEAESSLVGKQTLIRPASTEELRMVHASVTADVNHFNGLVIPWLPLICSNGLKTPKAESWKDIIMHWLVSNPDKELKTPLKDWPQEFINHQIKLSSLQPT
ncbi:hypothetical protein C8R48DRAFT_669543 [Suillus tomentosus]|nr:hypothetical protein C8R48DRAFT_669543 [Suillus tomentosus]